jgi:Ca-activated chloride channel family protein
MLPDGTAIGSGLATALTRLRRSAVKSKVVVLVTDGANNAGEIDPSTAADLARAMEVRVYTVLVGRGGEVPMPVQLRDPLTGQVYERRRMVEVQIDPELLQKIAERTGGEFFRATDSAALRQIFERIDRLETSEIKQAAFRRYDERYRPFLLAAAASFGLAGLLWAAGLRVAPA